MVTEVRPELWNAAWSRWVTVFGMVTEVRLGVFAKAYARILTTPLGMSKDDIELPLNEFAPMSLTLAGMIIEASEVVARNAWLPIVSRLLPASKVTEVRAVAL